MNMILRSQPELRTKKLESTSEMNGTAEKELSAQEDSATQENAGVILAHRARDALRTSPLDWKHLAQGVHPLSVWAHSNVLLQLAVLPQRRLSPTVVYAGFDLSKGSTNALGQLLPSCREFLEVTHAVAPPG